MLSTDIMFLPQINNKQILAWPCKPIITEFPDIVCFDSISSDCE